MRLFTCQHCGQLLYFENVTCESCGHALGYLPEQGTVSALKLAGDGTWQALAAPGRSFVPCANLAHGVCNWQLDAADSDDYCLACRHNRTVPDPAIPENLLRWRKLEVAKHRLMYTILKLGLPHPTETEDEGRGLAFDFLADPPSGDAPKVMTGHDDGLITIALVEADDVERERRRTALGEPYRTLLGHLRHEVGHYYWDRLVAEGGDLEGFRALFGDEREDYGEALQRHYANAQPDSWSDSYVSAYARAHPWEDWAETWTHYLHIVDTLETARAFRLRVDPKAARNDNLSAEVDFDVYADVPIATLIDAWLPLSFAINSLNRSMGQNDAYPFVLSSGVIEKLAFVHRVVHGVRPT